MLSDNKYIWWRIAAFCCDNEEEQNEIDKMRKELFSVCKQWRNDFKIHQWVNPTLAYCKAIRSRNFRLANVVWDFCGDCIDCRSEKVVEAVFEHGQLLHVNRIVERDDFEPSCCDNLAICCASTDGLDRVVRLLLQDAKVDPSAQHNFSIRYASYFGHAAVVTLLLQDHRVDPSAGYDSSIRYSSAYGHADVVELLLQDPRVDPSAYNDFSICEASKNGHADVVKLLLRHPKVDPTARQNSAVEQAIANGHTEVLRLLLR